jgi:hypothetical protein
MAQPEQLKGKDFAANPENINRTGANKGSKWMKTRLREMLEADGGSLRDDILVALVKAAKSGKTDAIKEILDRIDGKVTQEIDQNLTGGINIRFEEPEEYKKLYPTQDQGNIGDLDSDQ